jgi:AbiV family abortive infection protein
VDVNAVRSADRRALVDFLARVAENARELLDDAELFLGSGRWARAYSLAFLASEEWAKAYAVLTLSFMSLDLRAQIPGKELRRLLEGHQLKAMGAVIMRVFEAARPGVAGRVAGTADLASVLNAAAQQAGGANAAKERGLYADLLAGGRFSMPSDVTETEAAEAVEQAREVGASAALLHDEDALAAFADPPAEALALADALFGRWLRVKLDDAEAAAGFICDIAAGLAPGEDPEAEAG